jgi:hypothetical protein
MIRKEAVVAYLESLPRHSLEETEEIHEVPRSGWLVSRPTSNQASLDYGASPLSSHTNIPVDYVNLL